MKELSRDIVCIVEIIYVTGYKVLLNKNYIIIHHINDVIKHEVQR